MVRIMRITRLSCVYLRLGGGLLTLPRDPRAKASVRRRSGLNLLSRGNWLQEYHLAVKMTLSWPWAEGSQLLALK